MVAELILGLCLELSEAWTNTASHPELNEPPRFQTGFRPSLWTADIHSDDTCYALFCSPLSAPGELSNGGRVVFAFGDGGQPCPFQKGARTEAARNNDFKIPQPTLYQFTVPKSVHAVQEEIFKLSTEGGITLIQLGDSNTIESQLSLEELQGSEVFSGPIEAVDPTLDVNVFSVDSSLNLPALILFETANVSDIGTAMLTAKKAALSLTDIRLIVVHPSDFWFSTSDQIVEVSDGGTASKTVRNPPSENTLQAEMAAVGCLLSREGNTKAGRLVTLSFLVDPLAPPLDATTCQTAF
ncbi:MAG: hypothetical protein ABJ375_01860 [Rhizobiaceae bacterium]